MRDWEMAEHFAERDGVRMSSGQHIAAPADEMIDRARSLVRAYKGATRRERVDAVDWAEALLAERAAREEAERKLDSQWFMHATAADARIRAAEARVAHLEAALGILRVHYGASSVDALLNEHGVLAGGSDEPTTNPEGD